MERPTGCQWAESPMLLMKLKKARIVHCYPQLPLHNLTLSQGTRRRDDDEEPVLYHSLPKEAVFRQAIRTQNDFGILIQLEAQ